MTDRNQVEQRASQCWMTGKSYPWSGWSLRRHIYPVPWVSNASVRADLICCPKWALHLPPIHHCVFFHYPCLKTDTLTYGHVGLGKVSEPEAHHSRSPRWEQQSRRGGLSPVLDARPERTGLLTHPHASLRGCCHRGSLGRQSCSHSEEGNNFSCCRALGKSASKMLGPGLFLISDERWSNDDSPYLQCILSLSYKNIPSFVKRC